MIEKAIELAKSVHIGQKRKFDGAEYFSHPDMVANIVKKYKKSKHIVELVCAAYLHDVIEDGNITYEYLNKEFGDMISSLVLEVTNDVKLLSEYGKKEYITKKSLTLTNYALVIKLSDRLHNLSDIDIAPKEFVKKYTDETSYLIKVLREFRKLTKTQMQIILEIENIIYKVKKDATIV